ncbi:acyl carrier protein [Mesorhizobium marinum]|uniref:acyl carrier protein n=1 Tax=Mesorhizobium marinum TaxID=3228790 RepID=UPI0034671EB2
MTDETALECVRLFRRTTGLDNTPRVSMTAEDMLAAPIDTFEIDSLDTMEFIMAVEDRFSIELNEEAVNRCRTLGELAALVAAVRGV